MPRYQSFYDDGKPADQSSWLQIVERPKRGLGGLVVTTRPVLVAGGADVAWVEQGAFSHPLTITGSDHFGSVSGHWRVGYEHVHNGEFSVLTAVVIDHQTDQERTTWADVERDSIVPVPKILKNAPYLIRKAGASFQIVGEYGPLITGHNVWRDSDEAKRIRLFLEPLGDLHVDGRCLIFALALYLRGFPSYS